ncbi:hypothetical protein B566_EDAN005597 [Ephemera danica]|nr:hypothetical protein B566_EDAN005597 [Ephemera danica]
MIAARTAAMLLLLTFLALTLGLEESQNATRGRRQFEFARTELYEEQLLMSELQLDQQQTQQQLQALQMKRQFAVPGSAFAIRLDNQQTELLQRLQEDGLQFQDLQARLQLRVLQQTPSTPFLFRPHNPFNAESPDNEVRRRQSPQQTVNTLPLQHSIVITGTIDAEEPVSDPQFQQQGFQQPQTFQRPQGQVLQPQQRPQGFGPQQGFQNFQPPQNRPPPQQQQQQQQQGFQQQTFQPQQPQQPFNPPPQIQQGQQSGSCRAFNGQVGTCQPLVRCVTFYVEVTELRKNPCPLGPPGQFGVCCPPRGSEPPPDKGGASAFGVLRPPSPPRVIIPNLSPAQLNGAGRKGLEALLARLELAAQLFAAGVVVTPGTAAGWHQEFFQTDNDTLKRGEEAQKGVDASVSLVEELQLTPEQGTFALPQFSILDTVIADTCPPEVRCDARRKYRTADGSCNNIADGRWGRAGVAHQRILPPKYGDGVNSPRVGSNGVTLPSARTVSRSLSGEAVDLAEDNLTLLVMQWGQFLDHDLTHTPISKGPSQSGIACCSNGRVSDPSQRHPDCFPIEMPDTDPVFTPLGERCMEFVRSLPAPRPQCNFGPREQMNQITGYMDSSNVYGSNEAHQRELRLFQGGLLRAQQTRRSKMLLPESRGFSQFGTVRENLILHKNQFTPFVLYKDGAFDDFIRGLSTQTSQRFDRFFSREAIRALQQVYQSVEEVDLFPALVSERSQQEGALLGPTLVCLLSDQFARLRRGDRFFYEEEDQVGSFTSRQLSELKKTSLARVLCDNSDDVIRMQPLVFFKASFANQRVDCTSDAIPRMDLSAWKDEPVPV